MNGVLSKFDKFEGMDDGRTIKLGDDVPCLVKGKGSLMLNEKIKCDNVYEVQGLKYIILSVAQLNNSSHKLEFWNRKFKIFDDEGNLIGIGMQTLGNLFYLDPIVET